MDGGPGLGQQEARQNQQQEYRPSAKQKPNPTMARANKRIASRSYQLKTEHGLIGQYLRWTTRLGLVVPVYKIQTREHLFKNFPKWEYQKKTLWATVLEEARKLPGSRARPWGGIVPRSRSCSPMSGASGGPRFSRYNGRHVGRTAGPLVAEDGEGAASEARSGEIGNARSGTLC